MKLDLKRPTQKNFASDNNATVHPKILRAILEANNGLRPAYGADFHTREAEKAFQKLFNKSIEVYFVFNGTAANVLGLESCLKSYEAILCSDIAHINQDECGAPERMTGSKLIPIPSQGGKLSVDQVAKYLKGFGDQHLVQPKVISLSQSTEYGTLYSVNEIREFAKLIHQFDGYLHLDGARLANAVVGLNTSLPEMLEKTGVDVLTFGGTKNGILLGEAVLFLNKNLAKNFTFRRKQAMQLSSKMRFISCQFQALLHQDLWLENAKHANTMAKLLENLLRKKTGLQITQSVEANAVFALVPENLLKLLQNEYYFYVWNPNPDHPVFTHSEMQAFPTLPNENSKNTRVPRKARSPKNVRMVEVRWMTSFNTKAAEIRKFVDRMVALGKKL